MVSDLQGSPRRHDPRERRQGKGSRAALRARLQARRFHAARHRGLSALAPIDKLSGPEWYPIFKDLHAGMILENAGKEKEAGQRFERVYKLDDSMLRVTEAYPHWRPSTS